MPNFSFIFFMISEKTFIYFFEILCIPVKLIKISDLYDLESHMNRGGLLNNVSFSYILKDLAEIAKFLIFLL